MFVFNHSTKYSFKKKTKDDNDLREACVISRSNWSLELWILNDQDQLSVIQTVSPSTPIDNYRHTKSWQKGTKLGIGSFGTVWLAMTVKGKLFGNFLLLDQFKPFGISLTLF